MIKISKQKILLSTAFLTLLLISRTYASSMPTVNAQVTTQQKGLTILSNVIGLDLSKYTTSPQEAPADSYLNVVPQENIRYILEANGSKLDWLCTFANGNLRMIYLLESQGSQHLTKAATSTLQTVRIS